MSRKTANTTTEIIRCAGALDNQIIEEKENDIFSGRVISSS